MFWVISKIDFLVKLVISATFVGEVTDQHHEHHHSKCPYIRCLTSVLPFLHDFRRHIARRPTEDLHLHNMSFTLVCLSMQVLKPKSMSFGDNFSSKIIFYNLISRCAMFFSCRYFSTPASSLIMDLQLF